jgi:hypothetical protein
MKMDITDEFQAKDVFYVTLKEEDQVLYVTVLKSGGLASSKDRYLIPEADFSANQTSCCQTCSRLSIRNIDRGTALGAFGLSVIRMDLSPQITGSSISD